MGSATIYLFMIGEWGDLKKWWLTPFFKMRPLDAITGSRIGWSWFPGTLATPPQ